MKTSELNKHRKSIKEDLERIIEALDNDSYITSMDDLLNLLEDMSDLSEYHQRSVTDEY